MVNISIVYHALQTNLQLGGAPRTSSSPPRSRIAGWEKVGDGCVGLHWAPGDLKDETHWLWQDLVQIRCSFPRCEPCVNYLPTFTPNFWPSYVGKYSSTMVCIWVCSFVSFPRLPNTTWRAGNQAGFRASNTFSGGVWLMKTAHAGWSENMVSGVRYIQPHLGIVIVCFSH